MSWILAGLAFGFFGSAHCIGMCGPLAISLPGADRMRGRFLLDRLAYNGGRVITYTLLGAVVGLLGQVAAFGGAQQILSIGIGVIMVLVALVPWISRQVRRLEQTPATLLRPVLRPIGKLYESGGVGAMLLIGLLNGLLPCGFVYAALATAVTAGDLHSSMVFMAAFGIGTGPAMLGVSLIGRVAEAAWRRRIQRLVPIGLVVVGLLLILRGMGLGGMLSPLLQTPG